MLLTHFPNLLMVDVDRGVARKAAELRARYRVRPADALQVAAGLVHGATAVFTNDHRLGRLSSIVEVIMLDEFIG